MSPRAAGSLQAVPASTGHAGLLLFHHAKAASWSWAAEPGSEPGKGAWGRRRQSASCGEKARFSSSFLGG